MQIFCKKNANNAPFSPVSLAHIKKMYYLCGVKEIWKHILLGSLLGLAVWMAWGNVPMPERLCPNAESNDVTSYVLSIPAERPFAIEQNGASIIVPSMSVRQWTNPHVQGLFSTIARKTISSRKQATNNCRILGISLPPEQIAFPFSAFW